MKRLILILVIWSLSLHAQNYWGNAYGGTQVDEALAVAIDDNSQASVTAGYFSSAVMFGSNSLVASGICDIVLVKHAANGSFTWVKQLGGSGMERVTSVCIDNSGNIFITGFFQGSFLFGSNTYTSVGQEDIFIAKLDPNGNPVWFVQEGGNLSDLAHGICADINGDVLITGQFSGTADFGGNILTATQEDVIIAKYNGATGAVMWVQQGAASNSDRGIAVCTDENANVYVTGQFSNSITFDQVHNYNLYSSIYVIKFDPNGNEQWFRVIAGGITNFSYDIEADQAGNIYVTGDFTGNLQFLSPVNQSLTNAYANKVFLAKFSTSGNLVWAKADGSNSEVTSRCVDVKGNKVMIGGNFKCTFDDYSDMYGTGIFNSVGFWDCFVTSYDATTGNRQSARQWASAKDDKCNGLAIDNNGIAVMAGSTSGYMNVPRPGGPAPMFSPLANSLGSPNDNYCSYADYENYFKFDFKGATDIFTGKLIDESRPPYDYYYREGAGCNRPDLPVCIFIGNIIDYGECSQDSLEFCLSTTLWANSHTITSASQGSGPNYLYSWSNGQSMMTTQITSTQNVSVTITTEDQCYSSSDDIYVIINQGPSQPLISDDVVVNTQAVAPEVIELCYPDSALLTGTPVGNLNTYQNYYWEANHPNTSTLMVDSSGYYTFTVVDNNGCTKTNTVQVIIHQPIQSILPAMECINDTDHDDTVEICMNDPIYVEIFDQVTSINCIPYLQGSCYLNGVPYITFNSNDLGYPCAGFPLNPAADSVFHIECHLYQKNICDSIGYDIYDTVYTIVHPLPIAQVSLNTAGTFCSGDTVLVTATGNAPVMWQFFPAPQYFNGVDSAWISQPGSVTVSVSITDTNGCHASNSTYIQFDYPVPPPINILPSNGLICPDDSVQLSIPDNMYVNYQWFGPGSENFADSSSVYASSPGFFYCTVTDYNGCELTTDIVEISEYTIPNLYASPDNILCDTTDSVTLNIFSSAEGLFSWIVPPAGNSVAVTVNDPGIYICQVTVCGVDLLDSIEVIIDTTLIVAYADDSINACYHNSVELNSTAGYTGYQWQPGNLPGQSVDVGQPGWYSVSAIDNLGCTITSDPVEITVYSVTIDPPDTLSAEFCMPGIAVLTANGSGTVNWYSSSASQVSIHTGNSYTTTLLNYTTIYYVTNSIDTCTSIRIPVYAIAIDCDTIPEPVDSSFVPNVFTPNGDGYNDYINFETFPEECFDAVIYDRWGVTVFEAKSPAVKWYGTTQNGEKLSDGVYFYVVTYCFQEQVQKVLHGFVHLFN